MIGIDAVEIERFEHFRNYNKQQLKKIFTDKEIDYCLNNQIKSAERFASRFAAKEAFFKCANSFFKENYNFFKIAKYIEILNDKNGKPFVIVNKKLNIEKNINFNIAITHTKITAIAVALIIKN